MFLKVSIEKKTRFIALAAVLAFEETERGSKIWVGNPTERNYFLCDQSVDEIVEGIQAIIMASQIPPGGMPQVIDRKEGPDGVYENYMREQHGEDDEE